MHRLHQVSLLLLIAGVLLTVAGIVLSLSPLWTLIGLMLAVAGAVKVVVVYIWRQVLRIENDGESRSREVEESSRTT